MPPKVGKEQRLEKLAVTLLFIFLFFIAGVQIIVILQTTKTQPVEKQTQRFLASLSLALLAIVVVSLWYITKE